MRVGQRFESARRLSSFIGVRRGISINGNGVFMIPTTRLCGWDGKDRVLGGSRVVRLAESHGATRGLPLEWVYVGGREHGTVVIVPSGHGKSHAGTVTASRVIRRLRLLDELIEARRSAPTVAELTGS
jgi:hypothetical protein